MKSEKVHSCSIGIVALLLSFSLISNTVLAVSAKGQGRERSTKMAQAKAKPGQAGKTKESGQGEAKPDSKQQKGGTTGQEGQKPADQKPENGDAQKKSDPPDPCDTVDVGVADKAGQRIKLFYAREASKIAQILTAIAQPKGSDLHCLTIAAASDDEIILYGPKEKRDHARRIVAALDLPRPGIDMEMWGIQISSPYSEKMAIVIPAIREEIDRTQQAVRGMYLQMQRLAQGISELDKDFKTRIEATLGYETALDASRSLSLTDILLRMVAAQRPFEKTKHIAESLNSWYREVAKELDEAHAKSLEKLLLPNKPKKPKAREDASANYQEPAFENFFRQRGLFYIDHRWVQDNYSVDEGALMARIALLDFGLQYSRFVHDPGGFEPYYLQQSSETLNVRLQAAISALNSDMHRMFMEPTLLRIQEIVRNFDGVDYAQVGKTSVAGLSGVTTEVTSHSVSAFDVTPPLRLSELLDKATTLASKTKPLIPTETKPGATAATELTAGALPISEIIGLIGALGEERAVWRELQSGISLTITPNVLRNMTSAELQLDLKTADPQAGGREQGVRPLSRVSQHDVKTSVYVNALDFFDLSAFISQSTLNGGRGYVPIIGPVWQGLFGEVPGIGKLFSWQKPPKTVYHESLVLTNSFIMPTAMGIALLYPVGAPGDNIPEEGGYDPDERCKYNDFVCKENKIKVAKAKLRNDISKIQ